MSSDSDMSDGSDWSNMDKAQSDIPGSDDYQTDDLAFRPFVEQRPTIFGGEQSPASYFLVITANPRTGLTLTTDQQIHLLEVVTAALHSVSQDRLFFDWPALLKGLVKRTSGPIEGRQFGEFVDAVSDEVMSTVRLKDIIKGYEVMDTNEIVPDSLHEYINEDEVVCRRNITGAIVTTTLLVQEAEHVGTDQPAST